MEFETDKWTIARSKIEGVGVFLTGNVTQGECIGTAHLLGPDGDVVGYYSSLGRYHNHSMNPNFTAKIEGGFTRLYALRNCKIDDEVLVNYNDYAVIPNMDAPVEESESDEEQAKVEKEDTQKVKEKHAAHEKVAKKIVSPKQKKKRINPKRPVKKNGEIKKSIEKTKTKQKNIPTIPRGKTNEKDLGVKAAGN